MCFKMIQTEERSDTTGRIVCITVFASLLPTRTSNSAELLGVRVLKHNVS